MTAAHDSARDPIAAAARAGRQLGLPVLDAHGHVGSWSAFPMPASTPDGLVAAMDSVGVARLAISGIAAACGVTPVEGNDLMLEALARHPDRFIGYCAVPPAGAAALAEFQRCEAQGVRALKLHTWHGPPYTDAGYRATLEYVNARGYPILVHTWGAGDFKMLAQVAADFPHSTWILAHCPTDWDGYIDLQTKFSNVVLEVCCSNCPFGQIEYLARRGDPRRLLYGSDCGFISMTMQLGRVALADLPVETKHDILYRNAERVFRPAQRSLRQEVY